MQNPHEPEATYSVKGQGEKKKEHVGYKVQVAETVSEAKLAPGEPTGNFIMGIVTHPAYESDDAGAAKMEQEQAPMGWEKPPVQYVDSAYVSAQKLAQAQAEGREIIGPALPGPRKRADSRRRIFTLRWRSARRFVRPENPTPSAVAWSRSPRAKSTTVLNSAPSVTIARCGLNALPKVSDIARWWWASITPCCKPGARSNRPTLSSNA